MGADKNQEMGLLTNEDQVTVGADSPVNSQRKGKKVVQSKLLSKTGKEMSAEDKLVSGEGRDRDSRRNVDQWFVWVRYNHYLEYNKELPISPMTNQNMGKYENFMPIADNNNGFNRLPEKLRNSNSSMSKIIYYLQTGVNAP